MMEISVSGFLLGLLLLIVPIGVIRYFEIPMISRLVSAAAKMFVFMAIACCLMYVALKYDNMAVDILLAFVFISVAALSVVLRARLSIRTYFLPVLTGMSVAVVFTGIYFLAVTVGFGKMVDARCLISVSGLLAASSVVACADALSVYYAGLRNHNQLYYYLLGNGATHSEALDVFMRRAMQKALLPGIARMSGLVMIASPVVMWVMVMSGVGIFSAAACQVLLVIAVLCTSVISVFVTLLMAGKFVADDYGRLKSFERH